MLLSFLFTSYVLIAIITTVHVLLYKSDVRAAISWIGLTWFSPFVGSLIYYAFGINRIARKARKMRQANSIPDRHSKQFSVQTERLENTLRSVAEVGNRISEYPLVGGNSIAMLEDGDQAYPAMLEAIENAKRSLALSTYIFKLDETGQAFVSALARAKKRGVEVRVLVDGFGSGYWFSSVVRKLKQSGIKASPFMDGSSLQRLSFINLRNHKKLLIVDCEIAFVGGINLSSRNIFTNKKARQIRDTHFCVKGPIVLQLMKSFADDWYYANNERLVTSQWWSEFKKAGNCIVRTINSGPDEDVGNIESILSVAINNAKRNIKIVTPYFLPDEKLKLLLELAALRGVEVDIIVPERADFKLMDWASAGFFSHMKIDLLNCMRSLGVFDHSKLFTVDDSWCAFGSFNWDVRSMCLNFEIMVESYNLETVATINDLIAKKKENSYRLTTSDLEKRSFLVKLRDASARLFLPYL